MQAESGALTEVMAVVPHGSWEREGPRGNMFTVAVAVLLLAAVMQVFMEVVTVLMTVLLVISWWQ